MNYTLFILIGILFLIIIFVPGRTKNNFQNRNNKKISFKNTLKSIPSFLPHLLV